MFDQKHVSEVVNKINARTSELMSNSVVLELPMGSFAALRLIVSTMDRSVSIPSFKFFLDSIKRLIVNFSSLRNAEDIKAAIARLPNIEDFEVELFPLDGSVRNHNFSFDYWYLKSLYSEDVDVLGSAIGELKLSSVPKDRATTHLQKLRSEITGLEWFLSEIPRLEFCMSQPSYQPHGNEAFNLMALTTAIIRDFNRKYHLDLNNGFVIEITSPSSFKDWVELKSLIARLISNKVEVQELEQQKDSPLMGVKSIKDIDGVEIPSSLHATIRSSDYDGIFYAIPYSIWMGTTSEVVTNLESTEA